MKGTRFLLPFTHGIDMRAIEQAILLAKGHEATFQPVEEIVRLRRQGVRASELCVLYARVGSRRQEQDGNLARQTERLKEAALARGYEVAAVITEQACSLNEKRKGVKKLFSLINEQAEAHVSRKSRLRGKPMGKASRTTKLLLDLSDRGGGGANTGKRAYLEETAKILDAARAFYIAFFLAHPDKLAERVRYFSEQHQEERERLISPNELLSWAESLTVETAAHPHPLPSYNFSEQFPDFPFIYRRSVIKDAIGKVHSYLSHLATWNTAGKKKGRPGAPSASNHPTLYSSAFCLNLDAVDLRPTPRTCFARLKVYTGTTWEWHQYPVKLSRYFEARWRDAAWEPQSPKLILQKKSAALHFPQVKAVEATKVKESKEHPHLVTVAVDLNVKNLAVISVRQDDWIIESVFVRDHGLDARRYGHLKRIAKKQWQAGQPVKGEHSNQQLWRHIRRMNEDSAHQVAHRIAQVCGRYPGCVLLFERLRKIKAKGASKSRRMNRRQANQLRGKINQYSKDKAYAACSTVTVEVNPHGTSQYCSRCGAKGERFSYRGNKRIAEKWGKLFACPICHYEANADFNASVNVHRSFYREWHWQPRKKPPPKVARVTARVASRSLRLQVAGKKPMEGQPDEAGQAGPKGDMLR